MHRLECSTKILTLSLLLSACSGDSPTVLAPAIRSEVSPSPTNAPSPPNLGDLSETERVFRNDPTDVTLVDVALVFAYFQNSGATPEQIVEIINALTNENLSLADFDSPFPTVADAGVFANSPDVVTLADVAAIFAVFQGATELTAVAAVIANLVPGFDPADLNVVPGSLIPSPSQSPTQTDTPNTSPPGTPILTSTGDAVSTIDLGATSISIASPAQTITISNIGTAAVEVEAGSFSGDNPDDFTISPATDFSVASSGSATIEITCIPNALGDRTATITFSTNAPNAATLSYDLTCEGTISEQVNTLLVASSDADPNKCSLREAIIANNNNANYEGCANPKGTINFDPTLAGIINLIEALPQIEQNVTISGPGADKLTISGQESHRVFEIDATNNPIVTIEKLTLAQGLATGFYGGGAILSRSSGLLTLDSVTISDSKATSSSSPRGGGINAISAVVTNSTLSGNSANYGGAIYSVNVAINDSTLSDNIAYMGGGIRAFTMEVTNSTLISNRAVINSDTTVIGTGVGGAILSDSTAIITDSTISDNTAEVEGGGIDAVYAAGTVTVTGSTLSGNSANYGGGMSIGYDNSYQVTITESNLSGNTAGTSGGAISNNAGTLVLNDNNFGTAAMGGAVNVAPIGPNVDNLNGNTGTGNDPTTCNATNGAC